MSSTPRFPAPDFSGNRSDAPDDYQPRRSDQTRIKARAEFISQMEVGTANDWEQFVEQAKGEIDSENYEAALAKRGYEHITDYKYPSPNGGLLYEVRRYHFKLMPTKKIFPVRHREGDKWVLGAGPVRVAYNLLALIAQPDVDIEQVEGEKGVEYCRQKGLLASCVQGQNWTDDVARCYVGHTVNICMDNDDAGIKNTDLAAKWLTKFNIPFRIIELPDLPPTKGLDDWLELHSVEEYRAIVARTPLSGRVNAEPYSPQPEENIERYDWLMGPHLLRGEVSCTAAKGGTGKSSRSIVEALAMVTGRQLLHDTVPRRGLRVVLINLEDSRNTMDKRIAAAMRQYKLTKDDIGDRLIVLAKREIKFKVAEMVRGQVQKNADAIKMLRTLMAEKKADVLSIDSLIRTHSVNENDNGPMEQVIECYEEVAASESCAVHLWHHMRKGGGDKATIESARGAQSLIDSFRSVRIMEAMTSKEYDDIKAILLQTQDPDQEPQNSAAGYFFRSFNGKRNFAPPIDESEWFKHESIQLRNGTDVMGSDDGEGDNVGVVTAWRYPRLELPMMNDLAHQRVLDAIKNGGPWRADPRSTKEPWAGVAVAAALNLDLMDPRAKRAVIALIKKLRTAGKLCVVKHDDPHREEREYVELAAVK